MMSGKDIKNKSGFWLRLSCFLGEEFKLYDLWEWLIRRAEKKLKRKK